MTLREDLLDQLDASVGALAAFCRSGIDPDLPLNPEWSIKDALAHLVFWHENLARNAAALAAGQQPRYLKGRLLDLNRQGVAELRPCSLEETLQRLESAQAGIAAVILNPNLPAFPYRYGAAKDPPEKQLRMMREHILKHLQEMQKAAGWKAGKTR